MTPGWRRAGGGEAEPRAPALRGGIDEPAPEATVSRDRVVVSGWNVADDHPALAVAVTAGRRVVARALVGLRRPDVAEVLGDEHLADCGWRAVADLRDADGPTALLAVWVWAAPEGPALLAGTREVVLGAPVPDEPEGPGPDEVLAWLDHPEADAPLRRGTVRLAGWALTLGGPIGAVDVEVAGTRVRARLGLPRADLAAALGVPHAEVGGFDQVVDLGPLPATTRTVRVVARARPPSGPWVVFADHEHPLADAAPPSPEDPGPAPAAPARADRRSGDLDLVVFTHDLGYGGGQLWLHELLARSGAGTAFACTVVAPAPGPLAEPLRAAGVAVHVTQDYPVRALASYEGRIDEMAGWVRAGGHNAVLVNTFSAFFGADVGVTVGLPTVWAIHESYTPAGFWAAAYPLDGVDPGVVARVDGVLGKVGAAVFEAEATRRLYAAAARPEHTVIVPYGVDTGAISAFCSTTSRSQARAATDLPSAARVLLVMATTEPRKNQTTLAQAFAAAAGDHPEALMVFVGDTGSEYAGALRRYVTAAGLDDRVRIVPVVPDVLPWYRSADVLVSASDLESLPRSALEGMGCGVPVLAASVFGVPELITDGVTGFLFEPNDHGAATAALERVLDLVDDELARVGEAGRRLVVERYDSAGYATDVLALVEGLRERPDATPAQILGARGGGA
ncbi:MAG TPA: glycosyltransferase family 4 protein [Acidimicrobiales bacterium]|nr:glycosyltransferase family 4 protein [Acidimicrobiales bacterium]